MDADQPLHQPLQQPLHQPKSYNYKPIRREKKAYKNVRWAPDTNFNTKGYAVPLRKKTRPLKEEVLRRQDAMKDAVVTLHRVCGQDFNQFMVAAEDETVDFMRHVIEPPESPEVLLPLTSLLESPESPEVQLPLRELVRGLESCEYATAITSPLIVSPRVSPLAVSPLLLSWQDVMPNFQESDKFLPLDSNGTLDNLPPK